MHCPLFHGTLAAFLTLRRSGCYYLENRGRRALIIRSYAAVRQEGGHACVY